MTPRTIPEWRAWSIQLQTQTVQQAAKIRELLDDIERLLLSHEERSQALGEALNEVSYLQQRVIELERRLPDRLRIVPNEPA